MRKIIVYRPSTEMMKEVGSVILVQCLYRLDAYGLALEDEVCIEVITPMNASGR